MGNLHHSLLLPELTDGQQQLIQTPRADVSERIEGILHRHQPNDRLFYLPFDQWAERDQQYVWDLSELLTYEQVKPSRAQLLDIQRLFLETNALLDEEIPLGQLRAMEDRKRLTAFNNALLTAARGNDFEDSQLDLLARYYKTYRGMGALKDYGGNLEHPDLLSRSELHIRFNQFMNNAIRREDALGHWEDVQNSY